MHLITEEDVPLRQRKLILIARMDPAFYQQTMLPQIRADIDRCRDKIETVLGWKTAVEEFWKYCNAEDCALFMHHYAYADIPYGKHYDVLGEVNDLWRVKKETVLPCPSVALSFVMKFRMLPLETAAHGHSAFCLMQFPGGLPPLLDQLEVMDGSKQIRGERQLFVSSLETLQADLDEQEAAT